MTNYALATQIICGVILVVLFIYTMYRYPFKVDTKGLAWAALLVSIALVLNALSISFGEVLKINFALIPLMLSGVLLAPGYAFMVGIAFDALGLIITPTSYPFLGFTLSNVLSALLPAYWYANRIKLNPQLVYKLVDVMLVALATLGSIFIFTLNKANIAAASVTVTLTMKLSVSALLFTISIIIIIVLRGVKKRMRNAESEELATWMVTCVGMEVLISLVLNPLWLDVMFGVPMILSMFIRIVKECIMIPIDISIGYALVRALKRLRH